MTLTFIIQSGYLADVLREPVTGNPMISSPHTAVVQGYFAQFADTVCRVLPAPTKYQLKTQKHLYSLYSEQKAKDKPYNTSCFVMQYISGLCKQLSHKKALNDTEVTQNHTLIKKCGADSCRGKKELLILCIFWTASPLYKELQLKR